MMPFNDITTILELPNGITIGTSRGSGATVLTGLVNDGCITWYKSVTFYGREDETTDEWHAHCLAGFMESAEREGAILEEE
jgi:hypothetical protein